ncbi:hypothetical protein SAMN02745176_01528 [Lutispora thermophila DSM 19022]|uniref:Uncharacterized protein n=1 Tax=Lutispora thermophila DSM 19022 TaxID=1122184 RepID=A0A1M6EEY3_9FIRM|nr:hypothetical protein SAMN02745176_01528 [Lutispora thermophila DSM 19022]
MSGLKSVTIQLTIGGVKACPTLELEIPLDMTRSKSKNGSMSKVNKNERELAPRPKFANSLHKQHP